MPVIETVPLRALGASFAFFAVNSRRCELMFSKILIANRGECRVIATARRLGIATVADNWVFTRNQRRGGAGRSVRSRCLAAADRMLAELRALGLIEPAD